MTNQASFQSSSSAAKQPKTASPLTVIDGIFGLAASSTLDEMLERALKSIVQMLGAEAGSLLFHAQQTRYVQAGAFRPEALKRIQRWESVIDQRLTKSTWQLSETSDATTSISQLPGSQLTLVSTPLQYNGQVVGLVSAVLPPKVSITPQQRQLLYKMAGGLGNIATLLIDLETANQRLNRISVFYDVGQALISTFDINTLLSNTMQLATNIIDAGAASIMLIDESREELIFKVSHGQRNEVLRQHRIPIDEGIAGWVVRNGRPVIANDARADTRFSHRVDVRTGFLTQSIAAVPLKVKGRIIGVLEVLNKYAGEGFNQDDIQLMSFIATQAAIAIENARLFNIIKEEREQIIRAQETNYREITNTLHNDTLQYLSAISLSLDHLTALSSKASPDVLKNQIGALKKLTEQAINDTRTILFDLRPPVLETHGLIVACQYYVDRQRLVSPFNIHYSSVKDTNFSPKMSGIIFSILQEAMSNVTRHAKANNLWLTLAEEDGKFIVTVKDDGYGFDVDNYAQTSNRQQPLGIIKMREQAATIGGELEIKSVATPPKRGTTVRLLLPLVA